MGEGVVKIVSTSHRNRGEWEKYTYSNTLGKDRFPSYWPAGSGKTGQLPIFLEVELSDMLHSCPYYDGVPSGHINQ